MLEEEDAIDDALSAIGDFADLVSPYLSGHSTGVAELAGAAAERCGLDVRMAGCSAPRWSTTWAGRPYRRRSGRRPAR